MCGWCYDVVHTGIGAGTCWQVRSAGEYAFVSGLHVLTSLAIELSGLALGCYVLPYQLLLLRSFRACVCHSLRLFAVGINHLRQYKGSTHKKPWL